MATASSRRRVWLGACAVCVVVAVSTRAQPPAAVAAIAHATRRLDLEAAEGRLVAVFYDARRQAPAWTDADGAVSEAGRLVAARLRAADSYGLDPADYAGFLEPPGGTGTTADRRWVRDVAVTVAALRYVRHLERGRLADAPEAAGVAVPDDADGRARRVAIAADTGHLAELFDAAPPSWPAYAALVSALRRYRELASTAWPEVPPSPATVRPGEPLPGAPAIRRRLEALGDLSVPSPSSPALDPITTEALRRFQTRHGLTPDGVFGARTRAALRVPVSARIDQMEWALERLRWLPRREGRRAIVVNLPTFRLWAFDADQIWSRPAVTSDVIVGQARVTPSPVLAVTLEQLVFRPFWNVPDSIARREILPAIARDATYLARQALEVVDGPSDASPVVPADAAALAAVAQGRLRLRQRPGPGNALGLVSFAFPNQAGVFLHDTPTRALFRRERRDFSHGCIRVANAVALAQWALAGSLDWPPSRIAEAMASDASSRAGVARPTDVWLVYLTAVVDPEDGRVHLAEDLYGLDARLRRWRDRNRRGPPRRE